MRYCFIGYYVRLYIYLKPYYFVYFNNFATKIRKKHNKQK